MKKKQTKALLYSLVAVMAIFLAACGKQSQSKSNESASFKNEPTTSQTSDVKSTVLKGDGFWYLAGSINGKSNSGMEAIAFDSDTGKATMYNVDKYYMSYGNAQKSNALNKEGTVNYSFKQNDNNQTVIKLSGKMSGVAFDETLTVKTKTHGKNKDKTLNISGYKAVRDVDADKTNIVFVRASAPKTK